MCKGLHKRTHFVNCDTLFISNNNKNGNVTMQQINEKTRHVVTFKKCRGKYNHIPSPRHGHQDVVTSMGPQGHGHQNVSTMGHGSQDAAVRTWPSGCGCQNVVTRTWPPGCHHQNVVTRTLTPGIGRQDVVTRMWSLGRPSEADIQPNYFLPHWFIQYRTNSSS